MAKEMMIVFVYDLDCCQQESDDPVNAVLFFHPSWVSDVQKVSLCGQIMGMCHFMSESFAPPKIVALQNGKFVIKHFGRFILAVGTDRNISQTILEHRAELLTQLVKLFHKDIQTIYEQFSTNGQYKNLSQKLYHIFETYLPILQYNGNIFQTVPTLRLPKTSSNIFLDAIQTLQSCQQTKGVLGGTILYHNKVVATQLSANLTKRLVLTDPHRIKCTAEAINVNFHLPVGVQLIVVYISLTEYRQLNQSAQKSQAAFSNNNIPFTIPFKRKIKRDKSFIFSHIPEEEPMPISKQETVTKTFSRPTHLPLRFKNVTTKDLPESGFSSINFDESDSFPEFIGRTSVCSTPMTENKILHGNVLPICANAADIKPIEKTEIINSKLQSTKVTQYFFKNFNDGQLKSTSLTDLRQTANASKKMLLRSFGIGLPKIKTQTETARGTRNNDEDEDEDNNSIDDYDNAQNYRTITDPMYPVFRSNGLPISQSMFQDLLSRRLTEASKVEDNRKPVIDETIDDFDSAMKTSPKRQPEVIPMPASISETIASNRRALTLPLKSLNNTDDSNDDRKDSQITPGPRKKLTGLQLTPLMSKLTVLAMHDEWSSGFSSWDTTPGTEIASECPSKIFRRRSSLGKVDECGEVSENESDGDSQKVELYICGQQNMTMILLLEENSGQRQELIQSMWETSISRLSRIEAQLHQSLNINVDGAGAEKNSGDYSYIQLNARWDTVGRGGPWTPADLCTLDRMHNDFQCSQHNLVEMSVRTDDTLLYGHECGDTQFYYRQSVMPQTGLPPPADAMGKVALCAKRRLERDHSIILL